MLRSIFRCMNRPHVQNLYVTGVINSVIRKDQRPQDDQQYPA